MGQYSNQPDFGTRAVAITPKGFAGGSYVNVSYQNPGDITQNIYFTNTNLNVSTLQDGTPIPQALELDDWRTYNDDENPCWAYYNYTKEDTLGFGKIYNGPAVALGSGVLYPDGYELLETGIADQMTGYFGYNRNLGQELKSIPTGYQGQDTAGTSLWEFDEEVPLNTDIFNFTGLPGGLINSDSDPIKANATSRFWTDNIGDRIFWELDAYSTEIALIGPTEKEDGGYIRLVVDPSKIIAPEPLNSAALYVGTGGDLVVTIVGSETPVMFKNVPDASFLPIIVSNVWERGDMGITTASDIIAIY